MHIVLKKEIDTVFRCDADGYLSISQQGKSVQLSCRQVKILLAQLEDGHGLALESNWNDGLERS